MSLIAPTPENVAALARIFSSLDESTARSLSRRRLQRTRLVEGVSGDGTVVALGNRRLELIADAPIHHQLARHLPVVLEVGAEPLVPRGYALDQDARPQMGDCADRIGQVYAAMRKLSLYRPCEEVGVFLKPLRPLCRYQEPVA
jgi:hypothetical protein